MKSQPQKARVNIECSLEDRKTIKMLAAQHNTTISEFIMTLVRQEVKRCPLNWSHTPNEETVKALEESLRGEGIETHKSIKEMWKSLGIDDAKFKNN